MTRRALHIKMALLSCIAAVFLAAAIHLASSAYWLSYEDRALRTTKNSSAAQIQTPNAKASATAQASSISQRVHLKVYGTSIDYDLAQATQTSGNDFYLSHDYAGNFNAIGCPFIDWRTSIDATHVLIYAHSNAGANILFNEIKHADNQDVFSHIGKAIITYPDGKTRVFKPLAALSVDQNYQPIQTFSFTDSELQDWLSQLEKSASARNAGGSLQINTTQRVLTLVTCTSDVANQRPRTLVIFTSPS